MWQYIVLVGAIWGITNPVMKLGSQDAFNSSDSFFVRLFMNPVYTVAFLINMSGSVLFYITLSQGDLTLVVCSFISTLVYI
jgi:hypothetical protein